MMQYNVMKKIKVKKLMIIMLLFKKIWKLIKMKKKNIVKKKVRI